MRSAGGVDVLSWLLASAPIVLLLGLVLWGRLHTAVNGVLTVAVALLLGAAAFGAGPVVLGVGVAKGLWTGLWILCVVWPALLLFHLTRETGLTRLGSSLSSFLPRHVENVLVVGWVFPSLIQGVAGFGTPVAVAAPLLVAMGLSPVRAVAVTLVGHHWAVGFGSMGSSFYMGALAGGLSGEEVETYAALSSLLLGVSAVLSGVLACLVLDGARGLRQGWRAVVVLGPVMAGAQAGMAALEPALGAVGGAAAGLAVAACWGALRRRRSRGPSRAACAASPEPPPVDTRVLAGVGAPAPGASVPVLPEPEQDAPPPTAADLAGPAGPGPAGSGPAGSTGSGPAGSTRRHPAYALLPYGVLLAAVLAVHVPETSRMWVRAHLLLAPDLPRTVTAEGRVNPAVDAYTPIGLLAHPGVYLLASALVGLLVWRAAGVWPRRRLGAVTGAWLRQASRSAPPVLLLATVATVMADVGMVHTLARGAAEVTGAWFPLAAPTVGALGSFTTGSTTSANALFAGLQAEVAHLLDVPAPALLAGQLAGGNVGNIVAPMVLAVGASGLGIRHRQGEVLALVLLPALALDVVVTGLTVALAS